MSFVRFREGAAVIGPGWFIRLARLRLIWAPTPDPWVKRVVADEEQTLRLTITFDKQAAPKQDGEASKAAKGTGAS